MGSSLMNKVIALFAVLLMAPGIPILVGVNFWLPIFDNPVNWQAFEKMLDTDYLDLEENN
jgi:hypothetical protein